MGLEEFKAHVVQQLEILLKPTPPETLFPAATADPGKYVFVNADQSDLKLAEVLWLTLAELGAWVKIPSRPILNTELPSARIGFRKKLPSAGAWYWTHTTNDAVPGLPLVSAVVQVTVFWPVGTAIPTRACR